MEKIIYSKSTNYSISWLISLLIMGFSLIYAAPLLAEVLLIEDGSSVAESPENFRTTASTIKSNGADAEINPLGLEYLHMSGSAQFSASNFGYILNQIPKQFPPNKTYIVDIRQESHGFIESIAVTWYADRNNINRGKKASQIKKDEALLLKNVLKHNSVIIHRYKKVGDGWIESANTIEIINPQCARTEGAFVKKMGTQYERFYVLDHHRPSDEEVEHFVKFVHALPKDAWVHFHCRAGRGRTTLFMVMYDMIRNGKQVSFDDIVQRQIALGGSEIDQLTFEQEDKWKEAAAQQRYKFLQQFYAYVTDPKGYSAKRSWHNYLRKS